MKVVVNKCFGGFSVSEAVYRELGLKWDGYGFLHRTDFRNNDSDGSDDYRSNPILVAAIEKVGLKNASDKHSKLEIINVPDNVDWHIVNYDGIETIHENHKTWH